MTYSRATYDDVVWPHIADNLKAALSQKYPNVRLQPEPGFVPLTDLAVTMIVGLTGTGKTTTLNELHSLRESGAITYRDDIPTRRELADLVIIPTAQVIGDEPVQMVKDREIRFQLTRRFAQNFDSGGSAAAYGWLYYRQVRMVSLLSDGLRGPGEIAYALQHYPNWRVVELWVDPVLRLQRLSQRGDVFDQVAKADAVGDLSFLPTERHAEVQHLLQTGQISPKAIVTARAEAQNYGGEPYDASNRTDRYRCLVIDDLAPITVAAQVADFMQSISA